jgi:uncharacterized tellurite resistance protein B-like protein
MDFIFLPARVKSLLESIKPGKSPISLLRSNGDLEGGPGEGYVAAYDDKVFLFSKGMGEDEYQKFEASYGNGLAGVAIRKEKFNSFLDMNVGGKSFSIKFSSFEEGDLKPMLEKCSSDEIQEAPVADVQLADEQPAAKSSEISPMTAFAAAMMHLAATDNEIVEEENDYIRKACYNDNDIIKAGYELYQSKSYEELLNEFSSLDHQQALCVMANLIELAMADGVLHRNQQEMIWKFAKAAGVSGDYEKFREILLIKNQTTVLCN